METVLTPAIGYIVLSPEYLDVPPADQKKEILSYAQSCGYEIKSWIKDEVNNLETQERPELGKLLKKGKSGILVCYSNRLINSKTKEYLFWVFSFLRNGMSLETIMEEQSGKRYDFDTAIDVLKYIVLREYQQKLLTKKDENVAPAAKGMDVRSAGNIDKSTNRDGVSVSEMLSSRKISDHRLGNRKAPYGFDLVDHELAVNEKEMEMVKLIFKRREDGLSYQKIASELTSLGYRTRKGTEFSFSGVQAILNKKDLYAAHL